jgi:hypothetical protein
MSDPESPEAHTPRSRELLEVLTARADCAVLTELIALRGQVC